MNLTNPDASSGDHHGTPAPHPHPTPHTNGGQPTMPELTPTTYASVPAPVTPAVRPPDRPEHSLAGSDRASAPPEQVAPPEDFASPQCFASAEYVRPDEYCTPGGDVEELPLRRTRELLHGLVEVCLTALRTLVVLSMVIGSPQIALPVIAALIVAMFTLDAAVRAIARRRTQRHHIRHPHRDPDPCSGAGPDVEADPDFGADAAEHPAPPPPHPDDQVELADEQVDLADDADEVGAADLGELDAVAEHQPDQAPAGHSPSRTPPEAPAQDRHNRNRHEHARRRHARAPPLVNPTRNPGHRAAQV